MSDNINKPNRRIEPGDIKKDAFYFLIFVCVFFMSITSFTSSSDSLLILILRGVSFFILIFLVAGYGARLIESILIYIKDNNYRK